MGSLSSFACSNDSDSSLKLGRRPEVISISQREFLCKTTSFETIQKALEAFHRDGIVILQDAISHNAERDSISRRVRFESFTPFNNTASNL
jgi:hypothetical protein